LGAATKYVPLLIVPFLCVYFLRVRERRVAAAYATLPVVTFAAAWFPYVLLYGDAWHFVDALQYQSTRIGGGMNALVLFHFVVFCSASENPSEDRFSILRTFLPPR